MAVAYQPQTASGQQTPTSVTAQFYASIICPGALNQMTVSGKTIICPGALNQKTVTKTTTMTVITPVAGSDCSISANKTATTLPGVPPVPVIFVNPVTTQTTGGQVPPQINPITVIQPGKCFYPKIPNKPCECRCETCLPVSSSVDIGNGTYIFTETDLKVPARSIPIEMKRTFRSNQIMKSRENKEWVFAVPMDGPLGYGWHSPWFARAGDGTYMDGEGNYYEFERDSSGNYIPNAEAGIYLRKTAVGYELSKKGDNTSIFSPDGRLTGIKDQRGNTVALDYDTHNRVTAVRDIMNRTALIFT